MGREVGGGFRMGLSQNKSKDTVMSQSVPDNDQRQEDSQWHRLEASQSRRRDATFEPRRSKDSRHLSSGLGAHRSKTRYHCQPEPFLGWQGLSFRPALGDLRNRQVSITCVIPWTRPGVQ